LLPLLLLVLVLLLLLLPCSLPSWFPLDQRNPYGPSHHWRMSLVPNGLVGPWGAGRQYNNNHMSSVPSWLHHRSWCNIHVTGCLP
jgi:hypothetical protein